MNAGAYREIVTIEKLEYQPDEVGNQLKTWTEYYKGYAYVNNLSGSEFWSAAELEAEDTVVFTFRFHPLLVDVNTKEYQLDFRGRKYNITFVDNVKYHNETVKIRAAAKENVQV